MNILVVDIGGTHVKCLASNVSEPRQLDSGPRFTPRAMVDGVLALTADWNYDVITIGYPGPVKDNRPVIDAFNLGEGWIGFDFQAAFGRPVRIINDAAMQALGSYRSGHMLFLGLGTGLGSALVIDGILHPLELAHLLYRKGRTYEDEVGDRGLDRLGKRKWQKAVLEMLDRFHRALLPDYIVIGGGNARKLSMIPDYAVRGSNANAFRGGFLVWGKTDGEL